MCFPEFGPKRSSFELRNAWFELGRQIWKFQNLASTLERPSFLLSSARAREWWLERKFQALRILVHADARSSERTYARARTVSHARTSIERGFSTSSTFCIFTDRSSEEVHARATPLFWKATLERDPCFSKI